MLRLLTRRVLQSRGIQPFISAASEAISANLSTSYRDYTAGPLGADDEALKSRTKRDNRIRYYVISNRPTDALDLLERSLLRTPIVDKTSGKVRYLKLPPPQVCNKVLDSVAHVHDINAISRAAEIAQTLQAQGVAVEARTAQALLLALTHAGLADQGLPLLDGWLVANKAVLEDDDTAVEGPQHLMSSLLEAAARADDADAITQILIRMARVGLSPDPHALPSLIHCFMRLGHVETAHGMLHWMRRSELEVTARVYTALMTLPTRLNHSTAAAFNKKVREAYQDMKEQGVAPTVQLYAAYISACGRTKDLEAAQDAWMDMEGGGVAPDLVAYTTMIDACARGGDSAGAAHLTEEMKQRGIKPDAAFFSTVLHAVRGSPSQCRQLWNDMVVGQGVQPDAKATATYLHVLLKAEDSEGMLALLRSLSHPSHSKSSKVAELYERAVESASYRLDLALLRQLAAQMAELGVPHSVYTVSCMLMARARAQRGGKPRSTRWRLHLRQDDSKVRELALGGNDVIKALVESLDAPSHRVHELLAAAKSGPNHTAPALTSDAAAVLVGWLSEEGAVEEALDLYALYAEGFDREVRAWSLLTLLAGALAVSSGQVQASQVLRLMAEARAWSKAGGGWWWDPRSQRAIARVLRSHPEVAGLMGSGEEEDGPQEDMEAKVQRFIRRRPPPHDRNESN